MLLVVPVEDAVALGVDAGVADSGTLGVAVLEALREADGV
jgi:hypothetical protein